MKEMVSLAEAMPSTESWMADVAVYPAGEKRSLIQARSTGTACILHAAYAELLAHCREFKTLDEHLATFCYGKQLSGTPLNAEIVQGLRYKLGQLAQEGYLIPQSRAKNLFEEANEPVSPTHITTVGFLTCDRVETLQHSMSSYLESCQRFGRSPDFMVVDDSSSPTTREAYRGMLRGLQKRYGLNVAYAGIEEKTAYMKKLSEVGKIPEEVVSWACLGDRTYGVRTPGANLNAMLLHSVGECLFMSADDVICRVAASPGFKDGLAVHAQWDLLQYWFYPDLEHALEATPPVEQDILALHEQWLGQDPRVAGAPYSRAGQITVERAEPGLLRRLVTQPGKVALTLHGVVGDASYKSADFLFFHPEESLKRQTDSEKAYRSACTSRQIAQVVNQLTLTTRTHPLVGMYVGGMDNRELLPPYAPVGGGEDDVFGAILSTCFSDAYAVYLPWVLLHAPPEARSYVEPPSQLPFYTWLHQFIARFYPEQISTPADHLLQLGQFLENLGQLPLSAFEEFMRRFLWQNDGECISYLERLVHKEGLLASWKQDVEAYCTWMRRNMLLPLHQRLQGGPEIVQRTLVQFAQILRWWPAMIETARDLRAQGYRVAQPL